jgi:hypothetical protein
MSFLSDSYPDSFPNMKMIPLTEAKINGIINSFKYKNSSGYDESPPPDRHNSPSYARASLSRPHSHPK